MAEYILSQGNSHTYKSDRWQFDIHDVFKVCLGLAQWVQHSSESQSDNRGAVGLEGTASQQWRARRDGNERIKVIKHDCGCRN